MSCVPVCIQHLTPPRYGVPRGRCGEPRWWLSCMHGIRQTYTWSFWGEVTDRFQKCIGFSRRFFGCWWWWCFTLDCHHLGIVATHHSCVLLLHRTTLHLLDGKLLLPQQWDTLSWWQTSIWLDDSLVACVGDCVPATTSITNALLVVLCTFDCL